MLPEHDVGFGKALAQAVVDHRLRALRGLLAGLKHGHQRAAASRPACCERSARRAHQPGDMHVMAAGMRDRDLVAGLSFAVTLLA